MAGPCAQEKDKPHIDKLRQMEEQFNEQMSALDKEFSKRKRALQLATAKARRPLIAKIPGFWRIAVRARACRAPHALPVRFRAACAGRVRFA
jgi:hypothetical protein